MKYLLKKNLWTLFYILLGMGLALLLLISYMQYKNVEKDLRAELSYLSRSTSEATNHYFIQQEILLNVLDRHLFEDEEIKDRDHVKRLFANLLQINPALAGISVSDPDGNIILLSKARNLRNPINLKHSKESCHAFEKALVEKAMVVGRAFYDKALNEWILPLHKAARDDSGRVVAVLSVGLHLSSARSIWQAYTDAGTELEIFLDDSWYRIYHSDKPPERYPELYNKPITEQERYIFEGGKALETEAETSFEKLKKTASPAVVLLTIPGEKSYIISWQYIPKYRLWIHYHMPTEKILERVKNYWLINIVSFIFIFIVVYYLFYTINAIEKRKSKELLYQAMHDSLTNLPNRMYLQKKIDSWIYDGAPPFSVGFIDLDNFKNINDSIGHHYGDLILVEVAKRLKASMPKGTMVIRHGGDEFIMLCHEYDIDRLSENARLLIEAISQPYEVEGMEFTVGVSIGISRYPLDGTKLFELLSAADIAMYHAKRSKNSFAFFTSELKAQRNRYSIMEHELRNAIEKEELTIVYQPQIRKDGTLHGVEALVRWENRKLGHIHPEEFIKIAEESGLMPKVGRYIAAHAISEIDSLQRKLGTKFCLAINISIRQLNEKGFVESFLEIIRENSIDPSHIVVEITESLFIEELEFILATLHELKREGLNISLDDFGTGYSSLGMLRKLPIDELKIDKSFIEALPDDNESEAMVKAIITLGKTLGFSILAEGVEDEEQFIRLNELGCDLYQGYFFSKPLSLDRLELFIGSHCSPAGCTRQ
ncbi:diguanylate cyclase/phosphodiesterase (GGDEF & EAL domains) with PAS/PAC sensor [Hydrogenimonas sp.]|nr:diguanylate cyclase/phosphodiesterase (GGDEF & EAL domains) with PAS/PAC sensor [Hydrogenimonas sp.]